MAGACAWLVKKHLFLSRKPTGASLSAFCSLKLGRRGKPVLLVTVAVVAMFAESLPVSSQCPVALHCDCQFSRAERQEVTSALSPPGITLRVTLAKEKAAVLSAAGADGL